MKSKKIQGKTIDEWRNEFPIIEKIQNLQEICWINPGKLPFEQAAATCGFSMADVLDAAARFDRFASYFKIAFPETAASGGVLESPLQKIPKMKQTLEKTNGGSIPGELWIKLDSHLPISGSIKARGGIYEVLKTAEDIAIQNGLLHEGDDYGVFDSQEFRNLFSKHSIAVGSTGNLGLSIGIISAKLGFDVTVHMSADARQWKKDMLRSKGVTVVEYESDYSIAVTEGRKQAESDSFCHFVDDENSQTLFLGYTVAALRLKKQFEAEHITVNREHPLFVYLPCGVGGGPGGVAFGLKMMFGDNVHCFFAEPTHSCCMMLGLATGMNSKVSVQDFGVDNRTIADGLAVGRASSFVGEVMASFMSGCYSLSDERMYKMLSQLTDAENIRLEPSALAGMYGPVYLASDAGLASYLSREGLTDWVQNSIQLVWATGGNMVPEDEMNRYYAKGKELLAL
jgi:D-serine dehydratase